MVSRPLLIAVTAGFALVGCGTLKHTGDLMLRQLTAPAVAAPEYQADLEYLPVDSAQGKAWMVRGYADQRPGASLPVLVWYARPDLMLRTEGGRIVGARGFDKTLQRLTAKGCPAVPDYPRLTAPITCELVRDTDTAFGLRQRLRIDPPRLLAAGWDGLPGPLLLVREKVLAGDLPGSYYIFSRQGELLRTRQWIAPDFWFDLRAIEVAAGSVPAVTLTSVMTPGASSGAAPEQATTAAVPAVVDMSPIAGEPAVVAPPASSPTPVAEPASRPVTRQLIQPAPVVPAQVQSPPQGRVVPGQPAGFVRKVR